MARERNSVNQRRGIMAHILKILVTMETLTKIEDLVDEVGAPSKSDVIRRAIELYEYLLTNTNSGSKLILRDKWHDKEVILVKENNDDL